MHPIIKQQAIAEMRLYAVPCVVSAAARLARKHLGHFFPVGGAEFHAADFLVKAMLGIGPFQSRQGGLDGFGGRFRFRRLFPFGPRAYGICPFTQRFTGRVVQLSDDRRDRRERFRAVLTANNAPHQIESFDKLRDLQVLHLWTIPMLELHVLQGEETSPATPDACEPHCPRWPAAWV